jgi:hypothetical protein
MGVYSSNNRKVLAAERPKSRLEAINPPNALYCGHLQEEKDDGRGFRDKGWTLSLACKDKFTTTTQALLLISSFPKFMCQL